MCRFFSLISSGDGRVYFFSPEQRAKKLCDAWGHKYEHDSHTSIAEYFLGPGREDETNKWEYNVFTKELILDEQHTESDRDAVLATIAEIDFPAMCGDIDGAIQAIAELKDIPWMSRRGGLPDVPIAMYDTRFMAWARTREYSIDQAVAGSAFQLEHLVRNAGRWPAMVELIREVRAAFSNAKLTTLAMQDAVHDAERYIAAHYLCVGLFIPAECMKSIDDRWAVWKAGYGVKCDMHGKLVCYERS